jgi:hypothetical protein
MKNIIWFPAAVLLVGSMIGCGDREASSDATATTKDTSAEKSPAPEFVVEATSPAQAVTKFLEALRAGDEQTAAALLTTKAREETAAHDMVVEPPGAPNATYSVGRVEHPEGNQDAAYVSCVWSETFQNGEQESYEVVWVLRRESPGWRIAGMATQLAENEDPVFLDFEDLLAMENTMREAEAAQRPPATRQAQNPDDSTVR